MRDRERRFGAQSATFRNWVRAQDLVFGAAPTAGVAAVPVPEGAPHIARADRDYQIASAAFYNAAHPEARQRFLAIAGDATSPWRDLGTYLAARAALREGDLAEAERLFDAVVRNPSAARLHPSATGLLLRVRAGRVPAEKFRPVLAAGILEPRPGRLFGILVRHLALAIDRWSPSDGANMAIDPDTGEPEAYPAEDAADLELETNPSWRFAPTAALRAEHDLLDWVVTFQSADRDTAAHALDRWRRTRRPVWLVPAIAGLRSMKDAGAADVMAAAAALAADSPAHPTVTFHRARLLIGDGQISHARTVLTGILVGSGLSSSARNRLQDLRIRTARDHTGRLSSRVHRRRRCGASGVDDGAVDPGGERLVSLWTT